ncbi:ribonuclease [Caballeronia sp. LZ033]|uniref:ribonuclease n=1 Tax=Caballeronia sp. LZ033 TaxID=3038566 RepID=UPI0028579594|nr:ribonuclease [Caballeronia sp. LZ033]MDR5814458.1 ribonuclease [Caballeronia sp. LZ033]
MRRVWAFSCLLGLSIVLVGCGKDEPRSHSQEPVASATPAPVQPAEAVRQAQPVGPSGQSGPAASGQDGLATVRIAQLPKQAATTLRLIEAGGPFPYEMDGVVFGNRERVLPRHPRGYYHEYTVPTPRARDRGARRIVCGGPRRQIGECFYTDDHYTSFKRITD